ncbi:beta-N-acetylhexosaminidase [Nocardiopsis terrae]|uniref:beta-N-acetylhexosaminidase n=1 Tax=Nocardiopsis terrae TaxID=372655 RepID=A0ABR9HKG0_9ACTN|nr:beta-N-acetylhexosaminidase [Nocardiopsis terrae]MBE1459463.1 hexosaminidase [Nocardiopsis terrae]GHC95503.1 beta-N-acetylhexosaminidase [Nocardiopsis terrae]
MPDSPHPDTPSLLPRPQKVEASGSDGLTLTAATRVSADRAARGTLTWLQRELGTATGLPLATGDEENAQIRLSVDPSAGLGREGYRLIIDSEGAIVVGNEPAGVFYGAQTLRQLLPPDAYRTAPLGKAEWRLPAISITDAPRFRWRGAMLDIARHFQPKREILRFIDLLALHKLNVLHLHLTDDQGWRVEIRRYPKLTEAASWRAQSQLGISEPPVFDNRPHGGYLTQDDIREIVAYADARHVTVVPEIDVPGHSQAAIHAYPELGEAGGIPVGTQWGVFDEVLAVTDNVLEFYRNVLDEILELFPSTYVHVGGDECPKTQWRNSASAQQRIREEGLADEDELQSWFIRQLDDHLTKRGRRLVGWDEILEGWLLEGQGEQEGQEARDGGDAAEGRVGRRAGLAPGATVMSWRGEEGGIAAARAGHDVVMAPTATSYLDYKQSDSPDEPVPVGTLLRWEDVYASEPVPVGLTEEEARHVLGAQVNLWSEHIDSQRKLDYMVFPRLSAFAEKVWSEGERDHTEFEPRLRTHLERLDAVGVEYRPLDGPRPWHTRPGVYGWGYYPDGSEGSAGADGSDGSDGEGPGQDRAAG